MSQGYKIEFRIIMLTSIQNKMVFFYTILISNIKLNKYILLLECDMRQMISLISEYRYNTLNEYHLKLSKSYFAIL